MCVCMRVCVSSDPTLNGKYATNFVQGMQGDDEKYLKVSATLKHFAACKCLSVLECLLYHVLTS